MNAAPQGPRHVAIIMDGNGRWAKRRGFLRNIGHEHGGRKVKEILKAAKGLGVEQLTLYAFSTENWRRPKAEVGFLMDLLVRFLRSERDELTRENVRFKTLGDLARFPERVREEIAASKAAMAANTGIVLCLALSYGSRAEIVSACRAFARRCLEGGLKPEDLSEEAFDGMLETAGMPELDLLIRTSGECRVSNFLLWQLSYAELSFVEPFWPDFTAEHLQKAVEEFRRRDRRYGGLGGGTEEGRG